MDIYGLIRRKHIYLLRITPCAGDTGDGIIAHEVEFFVGSRLGELDEGGVGLDLDEMVFVEIVVEEGKALFF